jgi:GDP-4-dehydro-6-deoxy-D-mannose reductase
VNQSFFIKGNSMKALITGSHGFVGQHLAAELSSHDYSVFGIDVAEEDASARVDILDRQAVSEYVRAVQPNFLFHLAAQSSVPLSWKYPQKTFELNVIGTINLLEAIHSEYEPCRVIIVGSSDQYGVTGLSNPLSEDIPLKPGNPYSASKKAQEEIARLYAKSYSLDICFTRSFNHSGPGQRPGFLVPDFCQGIVQIERGEINDLKHGNLEAVRDFTDVRDIARAYRLIGEKGLSGETYNVGSGIGYKAQSILDVLLKLASRHT